MSDPKDPAIKLFGKTIQLPEISSADAGDADAGCIKTEDRTSSSGSSSDDKPKAEDQLNDDNNKDAAAEKSFDKEEERAHSTMSEDVIDPTPSSENPKTPNGENESTNVKTSKIDEEQNETSNSQEKTLKKPDKILPCPRCNSMDTKFCYYNNYNVNQPRHFCKNCQRYWTAGGTMRNVPVGAGRRKNKTSASQFRQVTVTETLQNDLLIKPNGTVLTFGSDTPLCESMASVLNIAEKTTRPNGFRRPEGLVIPVPPNNDENTSRSPVPEMQNCHGFSPPAQLPCFPGGPWPYPWNPQMGAAFCPPGFPMPFYPASPYWGCAVPGPWNMHWVAPQSSYVSSGPNSPTLGKHSREEQMVVSITSVEDEPIKENAPEKSLWVPKTLRIDDPDEAAKSSIWATLGIQKEGCDSVKGGRGGMFKAFQSKREEKDLVKETSPALQANPAALSRSRNFQESS